MGEMTDKHSFDYKTKEQNKIRERSGRGGEGQVWCFGIRANVLRVSWSVQCPDGDSQGRAGGADRCCLHVSDSPDHIPVLANTFTT